MQSDIICFSTSINGESIRFRLPLENDNVLEFTEYCTKTRFVADHTGVSSSFVTRDTCAMLMVRIGPITFRGSTVLFTKVSIFVPYLAPCVPVSLFFEGKESLTKVVLNAGPSGIPVGDACILHLDSCEGSYHTGVEDCIRKFAPAYMLISIDSFFVCLISFLETTTTSQVGCLI